MGDRGKRQVPEPAAVAAAARADLVLEALPRGAVVWDTHGTVLAWNRRAEGLYGWEADQILGRHIADLLIAQGELDAAYEIALGVEAGRPWSGDISILRPDGTSVRIHTVLVPLRDDDGVIVGSIGLADDVTDQRIVEQRAADLTNHLLMALAGGELGTFRWFRTSGAVTFDATMERVHGLAPGTFGGTFEAWVELIDPDDRERFVAALDVGVEEESAIRTDYRVHTADGSVRWVQGRATVTLDEHGSVSGAIGCSGDVTGRKLAELEIDRRAREAERLVEEGRLQRFRLEFLASLNEAALGSSDHRQLMTDVTAAAVPALGDWCSLHFVDASPNASYAAPEIVVAHHDPERIEWIHRLLIKHPYNPDAPLGAAAAIRNATTQYIADFATIREQIIAGAIRARPDEARRILDELQLTSLIAVPLVTKRGVIGAIQFVSGESGRHYTPDDVALAETAAGRVADALEGSWLREQQRHVASVLQAALLPDEVPDVPGLGIAARYWAAGAVSEVGGDFYDVFRVRGDGPERWAVVIGDVCGTGPAAAAVTSTARHTIRAAVQHGASPVETLEWLNDALLDTDGGRFCTVLFGELERRDDGWLLTTVTAGHPLPLLARPGEPTRPVGRPGTLLGVLPSLRLSPETTELRAGDTLVLHTDGVTDVAPPYGIDDAQLLEVVEAAAAAVGPAERVAERLGSAVQQVLPLPDRDDDIALVVVRVLGDPAVDGDGSDDAEEWEVIGEATFSAEPSAVATARDLVVDLVGDAHLADVLRLAVSELTTNAVIHAGSAFRVTAMRSSSTIRVEVRDADRRLPERQDRRPDAPGGRGIAIVEQLTAHWGADLEPDGKVVWFELPRWR